MEARAPGCWRTVRNWASRRAWGSVDVVGAAAAVAVVVVVGGAVFSSLLPRKQSLMIARGLWRKEEEGDDMI